MKLSLPRKIHAAIAELGGPVLLGMISLVSLLFVGLGSEIGEGETRRFDSRILLALRQSGDLAQPIGPHWLQTAMLDLTALGGVTVLTLVTSVAIGSLLTQRKTADAVFIAVAVGGGSLLSTRLKIGYARPRPGGAGSGQTRHSQLRPPQAATASR